MFSSKLSSSNPTFLLYILDTRFKQLKKWLTEEVKLTYLNVEPASSDASFRRYFRVTTGNASLILMDAPPEKENSVPFVETAYRLANLNVHTPEIHAKNLDLGFILLEDFGDKDYLSQLTSLDAADSLYRDAIDSLLLIQQGEPNTIERYSAEKLREEMSLFENWYLKQHLKLELTQQQTSLLSSTQDFLVKTCLEQPQVWVHRDFHSRNLMVTTENTPGVIDFQDMVTGPITYDLASLFKDCYIEWPRHQQLRWLNQYYEKLESPHFSFAQLERWFDLTAFQRHLKVLGIFCRLNYRDGKPAYLNDLPLVAKYCLETMQKYVELSSFAEHFKEPLEKCL